MKSTYLDIIVSEPSGDLASVSINFYDIATGPHHFDYDYEVKSVLIFR